MTGLRAPFRVALPVLAAVSFASTALPLLFGKGIGEWHTVSVGVGYASHGFVRRGLVGTLVAPVVRDGDDAAGVLWAVTLVAVVVLSWLLVQLGHLLPEDEHRNTLLVATVPVFSQFGQMVGHFDVLIVLVLVAAVLLVLREAAQPALFVLILGGLVHEVTILYGGFLLLVAAVAGRLERRAVALGAAVLGTAATLLLTVGRFEAGHDEFMARLPPGTPTEFNELLTRSEPWTGSVSDGFADVTYYLTTATGQASVVLLILVVAVTSMAFIARGHRVLALASILPTLTLAAVGIDHNRWLVLHGVVGLLSLLLLRSTPRIENRGVVPLVLLLLLIGPPGGAGPLPRWT